MYSLIDPNWRSNCLFGLPGWPRPLARPTDPGKDNAEASHKKPLKLNNLGLGRGREEKDLEGGMDNVWGEEHSISIYRIVFLKCPRRIRNGCPIQAL